MATEATTTAEGGIDKQQQVAAQARRAKNLASSLRALLADWEKATAAQAAAALANKQQPKGKQKAGKGAAAKSKAPTAGSKSKKSGPKDAKEEALAKLMQDLDEKINKAKKCKLDDLYSAVELLDTKEQHVLSGILSAYGSKLLGEQQANEASMTMRDSLCAAAAAHSYHRPQSPEVSKSTAATFSQQGLPAQTALEAGFTAGQLLRGGYSTAELVQSGAPLDKLRAGGISVHDLYSHLPQEAAAQLTGVTGAAQLKAAGYTIAAVQEGAAAGAFSPWDLKLAGYPVTIAAPEPVPAPASHLSPRSRFSAAAMLKKQHSTQQRAQLQQQPQVQQLQAGGQKAAVGPKDVQYFRHQIKPYMQMQVGQHIPPLPSKQEASPTRSAAAAAGADAAVANAGSNGALHSNPSRMAARTTSRPSRVGHKIKWQLGDEHSSKQHPIAAADTQVASEATALRAATVPSADPSTAETAAAAGVDEAETANAEEGETIEAAEVRHTS